MQAHDRQYLRQTVQYAKQVWPNAHLGDISPAEDRRSAFQMVRNRIRRGMSLQGAISDLEFDCHRYVDM